MEEKFELSDEKSSEVYRICVDNQHEYASGHWYISQSGLKKAAKAIGFNYSILGKGRRAEFRQDCISAAEGYPHRLKNIHWYLRAN